MQYHKLTVEGSFKQKVNQLVAKKHQFFGG